MSNTQVDYKLLFVAEGNDISTIREECEECYKRACSDYFWHNESFYLGEAQQEGTELLSLAGRTDVGENINDEWFIVYLLFEISKRLLDCVIQVSDSDGNFLLIEAAEELPKWLEPNASENRVFIHNGSLHIIPLPTNPLEAAILPTEKPAYANAYNLVTSTVINTKASKRIEECILKKIRCYPEKIIADFHHAYCFIPAEIVHIVQTIPNIVGKAVKAFYERDPLDVKICRNMKTFTSDNRLLCRVRFTKHLYSQLIQANFKPDPKSDWKLPNSLNTLYKPSELGFKLTCGFEILASRAYDKTTSSSNEPKGCYWEKYLASLVKNGYFEGELEGSKRYKKLLEQAKEKYKIDFAVTNENSSSKIGEEILKLRYDAQSKMDEIERSVEDILPEDDDDWMTVTPDELDQMMLGMWSGDKSIEDQSENLGDMVDKMKSFMDKVSSYEGAEVPTQHSKGTNIGIDTYETPGHYSKTDTKLDGDRKLSKNANRTTASSGDLDKRNMGLRDRLEREDFDEDEEFDPILFVKTLKELLDPDEHIPGVDSDSEVEDNFTSCKDNVKFEDGKMRNVMEGMDQELHNSSMSRSFKKKKTNKEDVDIDVNMVENFIDSLTSEDGWSGPTRNILQSMGINLPPDEGI